MSVKIDQLPILSPDSAENNDWINVVDKSDGISKRMAADHASSSPNLGVGTADLYGHLRITDDIDPLVARPESTVISQESVANLYIDSRETYLSKWTGTPDDWSSLPSDVQKNIRSVNTTWSFPAQGTERSIKYNVRYAGGSEIIIVTRSVIVEEEVIDTVSYSYQLSQFNMWNSVQLIDIVITSYTAYDDKIYVELTSNSVEHASGYYYEFLPTESFEIEEVFTRSTDETTYLIYPHSYQAYETATLYVTKFVNDCHESTTEYAASRLYNFTTSIDGRLKLWVNKSIWSLDDSYYYYFGILKEAFGYKYRDWYYSDLGDVSPGASETKLVTTYFCMFFTFFN